MCDSGTEISVLNTNMLPPDMSFLEPTGRYIKLQCAWGEAAEAQLVKVPAHIVDKNNKGKRHDVLICCAVTDKLHRDTALLTIDDVKILQETMDQYIPEVQTITGTMIRYTDPHQEGDQSFRRLAERTVNAIDEDDNIDEADTPLLKLPELNNMNLADPATVEKFQEAQKEDATLQFCWKDAKNDISIFSIKPENNLLYRKEHREGTVVSQLVLPSDYRLQVIYAAHDALWSSHFGSAKTTQRIALYFWWPGVTEQVTKYVKSCPDCQKVARKTKMDRVPIDHVERGQQAFDVVHIDLIGPLPVKSSRGHQYVLCAVCSLTRWPMAVPLKSLSAKELCDALLTLFSTYGIPRVIISDNGTNMVAGLTQEVYKHLGIHLRTSTPYHPEGNAIVERFNGSLKRMLHHIVTSDDAKDWDKKLPFLLWSYVSYPTLRQRSLHI
jgi:hypothetical protein